jgi:hypothetical protein
MVDVNPNMNAKEIVKVIMIAPQMNVARIMTGVDLQKIAIEQKIARLPIIVQKMNVVLSMATVEQILNFAMIGLFASRIRIALEMNAAQISAIVDLDQNIAMMCLQYHLYQQLQKLQKYVTQILIVTKV